RVAAAPDGAGPREIDVPLRRPRLPADRRERAGSPRDFSITFRRDRRERSSAPSGRGEPPHVTVTVKVCETCKPFLSVAVTVICAEPVAVPPPKCSVSFCCARGSAVPIDAVTKLGLLLVTV